MKVLVTGAAGFIGSHVARALVAEGHDVRALHLPGEDLRNLRGLPVELLAGDVTDATTMRRAVQGCRRVFHLAAQYRLWTRDPARLVQVNVEGTRVVLAAAEAEGVERVVHTSSIARFGGQGPGRRATEDSPFALGATGDLYSRTKADAHEIAVQAARRHDVVIVAPTGPIGPGDLGPTPTGRLFLAALTLPIAVVPPTITNFADVRDIARGHLLAAERGRRGESYLLGDADHALPDLVRTALRLARVRRPVVTVPFAAARVAARAALLLADRTGRPPLITPASVAIAQLGLAADCGKARRELGLACRPIDEAVGDAIAWFRREGMLRHCEVQVSARM